MKEKDGKNRIIVKMYKRTIYNFDFRNRHILHAFIASIIFMMLWTPYRYLTPILVSKGVSITQLDSIVKPIVKLGIILFCLKFLDRVPRKRYLRNLGIKKESLLKGMVFGFLTWFLYTITLQYATFLFIEGRIFYPHPTLIVSDFSKYLLDLGYYLLIVGFFEELLARGYILKEFYKGIKGKHRVILSITASGILFSLFHLPIDVFVARLGKTQLISHFFFTFFFSVLAGHLFIRSGWQIASVSVLHGLIDVRPLFSLVPSKFQPIKATMESTIAFLLSISLSVFVIEGLYGITKKGTSTGHSTTKVNMIENFQKEEIALFKEFKRQRKEMTFEEAAEFLIKYTGMVRDAAISEVQWYTMNPISSLLSARKST